MDLDHKDAEKRLELMVSKAYFEFETPAGVTIRGADDCSPLSLDTGQAAAQKCIPVLMPQG